MTYGRHRVADDHSWVVLMKMVAQSLVGSLRVGKYIYIIYILIYIIIF